MKGLGVLVDVDTIVGQSSRLQLRRRLFAKIAIGKLDKGRGFPGTRSNCCWIFAQRNSRQYFASRQTSLIWSQSAC